MKRPTPPLESTSAVDPRIIKRYSNRKLYDTTRSKYITLEEISILIKAGTDVAIIDNETKDDLTSVTLAQIILEQEKREHRMPLTTLRGLIQGRSDAFQEFLQRSVKTPVNELKDSAQKSVERSVGDFRYNAEKLAQAASRQVTGIAEWPKRILKRGPESTRLHEAIALALDEVEALLTSDSSPLQLEKEALREKIRRIERLIEES